MNTEALNTQSDNPDPAAVPTDAADTSAVDAVETPVESGEPPASEPPRKKASPLIAELTAQRARRREAEERAATAERKAADAQALLDRLTSRKEGEPAPAPTPTPQAPDDAEVDRRAEYKLFLRDVEGLRSRGMAEFGADTFADTIKSLAAYGADNDGFVRAVMEVDRENAHKLLQEISQDEVRAIGLVNMTNTQRIAELTRMSIARQTKTAEPTKGAEPKPAASSAISRAPRPAPAISASTSSESPRWSDKRSDKEFDKDFADWANKRTVNR